MFQTISNIMKRRKFRILIHTLPHVLKHRYGANEYYTAAQLAATLEKLRLKPELIPYAHAITCTRSEFAVALPKNSADDYEKMGSELKDLFYLEDYQLNCKYLASNYRYRNPVSNDGFYQPPDFELGHGDDASD